MYQPNRITRPIGAFDLHSPQSGSRAYGYGYGLADVSRVAQNEYLLDGGGPRMAPAATGQQFHNQNRRRKQPLSIVREIPPSNPYESEDFGDYDDDSSPITREIVGPNSNAGNRNSDNDDDDEDAGDQDQQSDDDERVVNGGQDQSLDGDEADDHPDPDDEGHSVPASEPEPDQGLNLFKNMNINPIF